MCIVCLYGVYGVCVWCVCVCVCVCVSVCVCMVCVYGVCVCVYVCVVYCVLCICTHCLRRVHSQVAGGLWGLLGLAVMPELTMVLLGVWVHPTFMSSGGVFCPTQVAPSEHDSETWVLDLARKQRMNTDVRKNIFCILMTSEVSPRQTWLS